LLTGQPYGDKKLCPTSDKWKQYKSVVTAPNFTLGFVPRLFDQLNKPQRIIVYGRDGYYQHAPINSSHRVRIVGGVINQLCPKAVCTNPNEWLSSLILIAVDPSDKKFKKVKALKDLDGLIDWDYTKVFLENSLGRRVLGKKEYAVTKISSIINMNQVFRLIENNSLFWDVDRITSVKKNCLKLYAKIKSHGSSAKSFFDFMRKGYGPIEQQLGTCFKYVYPQSFNESSTDFSFFTYIQAYQYLHDLGYFYSCSRGGWQSNPVLNTGKRAIDVTTYRKSCLSSELDNAIKTSVQFMGNILSKLQPAYRFITYDNRLAGATHTKHYSWTPFDGRVSTCKNEDAKLYSIQKTFEFPVDIKWKRLISTEKKKSLIID
jgi:hypothetical protein